MQAEIDEGIPQVARALLLHTLWVNVINRYADDLSWIDEALAPRGDDEEQLFVEERGALQALIDSGVGRDVIGRLARSLAFRATFDVLYHLDYGSDPDVQEGPGWLLAEVDLVKEESTGRVIGGLHEDLLTSEPR